MSVIRRVARRQVLILLIYLLIGLLLTYPLVLRFDSHVPGDGIDDPALAWNLWWVKYALVDRQINPFACAWMFYPLGINLAFYTLTILNGMLSVPLQSAWGLVPASNALLLSSFVLGAYGAYLLVRHLQATRCARSGRCPRQMREASFWRREEMAAVFAGLVYAFSSSKLFYASLGQFNIASSQWIPFTVLYVLRARSDRTLRSSTLAGVFLVLQAYAELTFASFLIIFIVLYAAFEFVCHTLGARRARAPGQSPHAVSDRSGWLPLRNLLLLALIFVVGITPFLANMLPDLHSEGDFFTSGGGFSDVFSADLLGYAVPTQLHPFVGAIASGLPFPHDKGQHIYLGYSIMFLAVLGAWRGRRSWSWTFWTLCAMAFWLLTLGPYLRVGGSETAIAGPFALLARLPFFKGNRYPSRYSVMLVLSVAVLASQGLRRLLDGTSPRASDRTAGGSFTHGSRPRVAGLSALFAVVFLVEHLSVPLPLSSMQVPAVYDVLAAERSDFAIMELPLGWRNGARVLGAQDVVIMFEQWYQTRHEKRLLGGNTSRNPEFKFQYFAEAPLLSSLIALENGHQVPLHVAASDRAMASSILTFLDVRYVVVHWPEQRAELVKYVEDILPVELIAEADGARLYRVAEVPSDRAPIDLSNPLGRMHLAEGWSPVTDMVDGEPAVWAQRREARMLVRLRGDEQLLRFRAWGPSEPQAVEIWAQGRPWASVNLSPGWRSYEVPLTEGAPQPGLSDVRLRFSRLVPIRSLPAALHAEEREIAGQPIPRSIVVQSAGLETGGNSLAHVYVDGEDLSPNSRGYNVVALSPEGDLLLSAAFDTHADASASQRLAQAMESVREGSIVAVAVADEASMNLGGEAVDALHTIGAVGDLRQRFRWGHAIIGAKGMLEGQAVEAMDLLQPVVLRVGVGATESSLAAAFASLQFAGGQ